MRCLVSALLLLRSLSTSDLKSGDKAPHSKLAAAAFAHMNMEWLDWIQWPAMAVTVVAAWMIASRRKFKRNWAFWLFLLSNVLWIVWGIHDRAYALILLQVALAILNVRGAMKTREA